MNISSPLHVCLSPEESDSNEEKETASQPFHIYHSSSSFPSYLKNFYTNPLLQFNTSISNQTSPSSSSMLGGSSEGTVT